MYIPQSHGVGFTMASRNWFAYYWSKNALGYRDSPDHIMNTERPRIVVAGDSFTAGHGIKRFENTFTGKMRALLKDNYEVMHIGFNGADSRHQASHLKRFPHEPDVFILQYFGNDIHNVATECGLVFDGFDPYHDLSPAFKVMVQHSSLLNFCYWQFPHHKKGQSYFEYLNQAYQDRSVVEAHQADLQVMIDHARDRKIPMVVIMFPFMRDLKMSELYIKPMTEYFKEEGVPVLSVSPLIEDLSPQERVVNVNDAHPNEEVHRRVAIGVSRLLDDMGLLSKERTADQLVLR
jgi:hypothetical protein